MGLTLRVFVMFAALIIAFVLFKKRVIQNESVPNFNSLVFEDYNREDLLPSNGKVQIINHKYYSIGYDTRRRQALWTCHVLNKNELLIPNVERYDYFEADHNVEGKPVEYHEYTSSGYSRGHLVPAADMAFDHTAMKETFLMSNISPQIRAFNGGIWRELEQNIRKWAVDNERLYVITGPIFQESSNGLGDQGSIDIPSYFFKAVLDLEPPELKSIGFVIPNRKIETPLSSFAVTIDELEAKTGFDFFDKLYDRSEDEIHIEREFEPSEWPIDESFQELRINRWNNQ